jgi:hypothetical protein
MSVFVVDSELLKGGWDDDEVDRRDVFLTAETKLVAARGRKL